jgi:hypothetical protein
MSRAGKCSGRDGTLCEPGLWIKVVLTKNLGGCASSNLP